MENTVHNKPSDQLRADVRKFLDNHPGITAKALSKKAGKSVNFVQKLLRMGVAPSIDNAADVRRAMREIEQEK